MMSNSLMMSNTSNSLMMINTLMMSNTSYAKYSSKGSSMRKTRVPSKTLIIPDLFHPFAITSFLCQL